MNHRFSRKTVGLLAFAAILCAMVVVVLFASSTTVHKASAQEEYVADHAAGAFAGTMPAAPPDHADGAQTVNSSLAKAVEPAAARVAVSSVQAFVSKNRPDLALEEYRRHLSCAIWTAQVDSSRDNPPSADIGEYRRLRIEAKNNMSRACSGLTRLPISERIALVEYAAQNTVPGAAVAFAAEGPFGDPQALELRPDDLAVVEWKVRARQYLGDAASAGDIEAAGVLSNDYLNGILGGADISKGLAYLLLERDLSESLPTKRSLDSVIEKYRSRVSADDYEKIVRSANSLRSSIKKQGR